MGIVGDLVEYVYHWIMGADKESSFSEVVNKIIETLETSYGIRKGTANATSHVVGDLGFDSATL